MASTYDIGDIVRISSTFTDTAGDRADPTSVYFAYETPDGTASALTFGVSTRVVQATTPSTGVFYVDVTTTALGQYEYRFSSTGTITASAEGYFSVRPRRVTT